MAASPVVYGLVEVDIDANTEEKGTSPETLQIELADAGVEKEQEMMASTSQKEPNSFSALQVSEIVKYVQGILGKGYHTDHVKWVVAQIESDDNLATYDAKVKVETEVITKLMKLQRDFLNNPPPQLEPGAAALLARWSEEEDRMLRREYRVHHAAEMLDAFAKQSGLARKLNIEEAMGLLLEAVLQGHLMQDEVQEAFLLYESKEVEPKEAGPKNDREDFAGLPGASKYIIGPPLLLIGLCLSIALGVVWLCLYFPLTALQCGIEGCACTACCCSCIPRNPGSGQLLYLFTDIVYHYVVMVPWNFAFFLCTGDRSVLHPEISDSSHYGGSDRPDSTLQSTWMKWESERKNEAAQKSAERDHQNWAMDLERRMASHEGGCS